MIRVVASVLLTALIAVACTDASRSAPAEASASQSSSADASGVPSEPVGVAEAVPNCANVPPIEAPPERYAEEPVYVGNEMPTEAVHRWASEQAGFEGIWIDRGNFGWVTVAFSIDADARQAELEEMFPDDGVVAVAVDWTNAELEALQGRIVDELSPLFPVSTGTLINHGVVNIGIGVLSPERLAVVDERFASDRVCVEGMDPVGLPQPGPQPLAGDGWQLIADEATGSPYRTGIAWDDASLGALWVEAGLAAEVAEVDFTRDVAIWFGAVFSGSCPDIRLDDVVIDQERRIVHAEIVQLDVMQACTADANPRAWVVTLERSRLPVAPFSVQLGSPDSGSGVPEERTVVEADLRVPGSVAVPNQVHGDPGLPEPSFVESGQVIEPNFDALYRMSVHCGVEWLGELNGINWRAEVPAGEVDWVPPAWQPVVTDETLTLDILMREAPDPTVTATANGLSVVYRPSREALPGCD